MKERAEVERIRDSLNLAHDAAVLHELNPCAARTTHHQQQGLTPMRFLAPPAYSITVDDYPPHNLYMNAISA